jgi:hypothetical protein
MDIRGLVDQWVEALQGNDVESLAELLHPDFVEVYPQSGELIRGIEKLKAIVSAYPGLPEGEVIGTSGGGSGRTNVIPSPLPFGLPTIQVSEAGHTFTVEAFMQYPNGERYFGVWIGELKDGKVYRLTTYFAQPFEAPAWRAPYVERIPEPQI